MTFEEFKKEVNQKITEMAGVDVHDLPDTVDQYDEFLSQALPYDLALMILTNAGFPIHDLELT